MITLQRTNSEDPNFQTLVTELDKDLSVRDGADHAFFAQFNKTDSIKHVVVAYNNGEPIGCGAVKQYDVQTMEVKRMFVPLHHRGLGIATLILKELEKWSKELSYEKCILETGEKQPEAIQLYHKNNYQIIPNFGQYAGVESSVCFEKNI